MESIAPARPRTTSRWMWLAVFALFAGAFALPRLLGGKELIPWRGDLAAAKQAAAGENKPVFLYFTASWCGPCQGMKTTTWADRGVDAALRSYVPVKLDVDEHPDAANAFHVDGIPAFFVLDPHDGHVLKNSSGAMESGEFLRWLRG